MIIAPDPAVIPWYKSPVMVGAVVTLVSTLGGLARKFGVDLGRTNPDAGETAVTQGFSG